MKHTLKDGVARACSVWSYASSFWWRELV